MGLGAGIETDLHESIVLCKVSCIELVGLEIVVDQWLPRCRQAEDIETVGVDEVLHLARRHVRRWTRVLLFEVIRIEVALVWCQYMNFHFLWDDCCPLTLVSIPISHPAMFRPASQTALACATKADARIERSITS
jgi:hypothetical protein